jgi:hypothetical protein
MHSRKDLSCVRTSTPAKGSNQSLRPFILVRTGRHLEEDVVLCSLTATKNRMTRDLEQLRARQWKSTRYQSNPSTA